MARRWQPRCFPRGTAENVLFSVCRPLHSQPWFDKPVERTTPRLQALLDCIQSHLDRPQRGLASSHIIWDSLYGT